ncbi:MAG: acetyl-CoA carboxylase carboxyltransferase subunit alpha [Thermodesulfovibrionales bacterium]|nr:acetyl-CoA carboxylase carboxyltransferase subunit alpha [Thermodesulfovibrionales bacterium]
MRRRKIREAILNMPYYLDFEKPIEDIENKIRGLKDSSGEEARGKELRQLEKKAKDTIERIYLNLTPWQKSQIARHPERPYTLDYINLILKDFVEFHGDRRFGDDPSIVGGIGLLDDKSVMVIGHQKGRGTKERIYRNFGQPHPEGYRKALRLMKLAERFKIPVITFIDTPGAYPGIGAEERGQAEAIATNLMEMSLLKTPIVSIVIGEGGSGGALALSVADRLCMLEHSTYSVISPEGCAAILWKKSGGLSVDDFSMAANSLKLTAQDLKSFGIIDDIIPEPLGGAHRDPELTAERIKEYIKTTLEHLMKKDVTGLVEDRYRKLRGIGAFKEIS